MQSREYKIIRAPSLDRLELLVNNFLKLSDNSGFSYLGGPKVFGHEEYIQVFVTDTSKTIRSKQ